MHIHILGICGTFMGGVAVLARADGHRVTGCDAQVYPPMSTQLAAQNIDLIEGYGPDQIALKPDLWVIGNVISRGNPLIEAILDHGLPYTSGPQWVGEHILNGRRVCAVAGTHGKTTTSAMLAWILEDVGYDPGFLIGGVPLDFGVSARLTQSPFFVIEADEYDSAFFDKRSKFVHYRPRIAILNNLEYDHADIFPDIGAIETQFHHLVRTVPRDGLIVANGNDEAIERVLARGSWTPIEYFGAGCRWEARVEPTGVQIWRDQVCLGDLVWGLQGRHNLSNALAAMAGAHSLGVAPGQAIDALSRFAGVKRRMEVRGIVAGITVYDDFAHHPSAIATTLAGLHAVLHSQDPDARILAVLEPRSNTMKLGVMKEALPQSLEWADHVFGYGARTGTASLGWDLAAALHPLGEHAQVFDDIDQLVGAVVSIARPRDHIVVMSNGGFGGVHEKLLAALTPFAAPS